ncbi:MAG: hypothetical protein ACRDFB_06665, partial [Rhabdochlamydiaceae bacterium]
MRDAKQSERIVNKRTLQKIDWKMKTSHLAIIVILSISVMDGTGIAFAQQPLLDFYNNSQMVLVGKVISLSQVPTTLNDSSQS